MRTLSICAMLSIIAGYTADQIEPEMAAGISDQACAEFPRATNAALPLATASDDWFQVYESAVGVYSIVEPYQFQETISHLIVGEKRALLFDTGIGVLPIRPVVERITSLPVTVLNSHSHYDHVGGNAEFASILAIDSEYTRTNMAGFAHEQIAEDFNPDAFCKGAPEGINLATHVTRPWQASGYVKDGEILDLGGRKLEILQVPGHTPDAVALLDQDNGLLFTGDTFYDAELWLFDPETNLDDFARSIARLAGLESELRYLLGAHTSARVDAGRLAGVQAAFEKLRTGKYAASEESAGRSTYRIDGVEFVTAPLMRNKE
jgi:glyoxylase-like metal-dependent hydrolase (beta-lactamase superfamily II)